GYYCSSFAGSNTGLF
nr:immunoglobulin light chain junction region [Macaca mulatta]